MSHKHRRIEEYLTWLIHGDENVESPHERIERADALEVGSEANLPIDFYRYVPADLQ